MSTEFRNLSGVFFPVMRANTRVVVCFEELTETERAEVYVKYTKAETQRLCEHMVTALNEVATCFNLHRTTKIE